MPSKKTARAFPGGTIVALPVMLAIASQTAAADGPASEWARSPESRARLVAGRPAAGAGPLAGVEIEMGSGWKTYWRNPGDAGGVPPTFDWTGSENVKASVLYPAPHRYVDRAGETIGYKNAVTFPVTLAIVDPKQPAKLRLHVEYGVCREICIPSEADLALDIPPDSSEPSPASLGDALARVPSASAKSDAARPELVTSKAALTGDKPHIAFEVAYPGAVDSADAFAEGPTGVYVPMPHRVATSGRNVTYEIDLTGIELADLKGKDLTLTLVSEATSSEVVLPLR